MGLGAELGGRTISWPLGGISWPLGGISLRLIGPRLGGIRRAGQIEEFRRVGNINQRIGQLDEIN